VVADAPNKPVKPLPPAPPDDTPHNKVVFTVSGASAGNFSATVKLTERRSGMTAILRASVQVVQAATAANRTVLPQLIT
jgi:hypothetical protein